MVRYTKHHQVNIDELKYYCFWCDSNRGKVTSEQHKLVPTYIEFDLALHLYEAHKLAMVKLPIGKGSMDIRIAHAVEHCKAMTLYLRKYPDRWTVAFNSDRVVPHAAGGKVAAGAAALSVPADISRAGG